MPDKHSPPKIAPFEYAVHRTPRGYECSMCSARNVKLWRKLHMADNVILCALCVCASTGGRLEDMDIDHTGRVDDPEIGRTDHFRDFVPAVPDEEGTNFWGFTSVPEDGVEWWRRLTTLPAACS